MTQLIGQQLGRYEIQALQGRGGMAQVYKAWDPNTQRHVAIKVLHQHLVDESSFKERFAREGTLIAGLNHPNIVQLYDFDRQESPTGTIHYMVMPFISGPTLKTRLEALNASEERLPLDEVARIVDGIAAALDYAHAKEMVHRDIKPGNILFDESDTALLTDFGLARMTFGERLTQSGVTSGTPAYMSPEQGVGDPGDYRSDIYSLGVILYEMLTNRLPFTADSSLGLLMKHINDPLPSPRQLAPDLSPAIEAVVYRATAKEPASRYDTAGQMAAELHTAIHGDAISSQTRYISRQQRGTTSSKLLAVAQSRNALWGSFAILLALVILLGAAILQQRNPNTPTPLPASPTPLEIQSMVSGPVEFSTGFNEGEEFNDGWPLANNEAFATAIEDGHYTMRATVPGQAYTAMFLPDYYSYTSLLLETEMTLSTDSQPDSGFGVIFRYQDPANYYVFTIDGQGRVSIWALEDRIWRELRGGETEWTFSEAVNTIGEPNLVTVNAIGNHLYVLVNSTRVVDVFDDTFQDGGIGFYVATTVRPVDSTLAEVYFERIAVTPATPSMSG